MNRFVTKEKIKKAVEYCIPTLENWGDGLLAFCSIAVKFILRDRFIVQPEGIKEMKIAIAGTGCVGLSNAILPARKHEVYAVVAAPEKNVFEAAVSYTKSRKALNRRENKRKMPAHILSQVKAGIYL